jgi:hypothetical protein
MHFIVNAAAALTLFACSALAHEYPLQFTAAAVAPAVWSSPLTR